MTAADLYGFDIGSYHVAVPRVELKIDLSNLEAARAGGERGGGGRDVLETRVVTAKECSIQQTIFEPRLARLTPRLRRRIPRKSPRAGTRTAR